MDDLGRRYSAPQTNNRRAIGFVVVVLLHIGFFYALTSGLAKTLVDKITGPLETRVIEEIKAEAEAPPPPPPKFQAPPPVFVDMPAVDFNETATSQTIDPNAQAKAAPPPPKADITVPPKQNPRSPITQPEYPTLSRRLGEEGAVILLLAVNEEGRVIEAKVDTTSGFERLDETAVKEALRPRNWKFIPGTVNGKPASMSFKFRVVFKIEK